MEKKKKKKRREVSSYSGWCLNADADQSQWLHATLSELEKKIKMMVSIIEEEEEETFTETKYKNRPKLIEMIKDLHLWYLTLADDYKRNHPCLPPPPPPTPVPTSSLRQLNTPKFNNNLSEEDVPAPNSNCGAREEEINNNKDEEKPNNDDGIEEEGGNDDDDDVINVIMGKEGVRMMKMWRSLVEENKRQQDELIKRNNEKRDEIKELWLQIGKLKKENKALKTSLGLGHTNFDMMKMMMLINNQNNKSTPSSTTTTTTISSRLKSFLLPAKFFR